MSGTVLPLLNTVEDSIRSHLSHPLTHIVCAYLNTDQKARLQKVVGTETVKYVSLNWLYGCIDQCSCLPLNSSNEWEDVLYRIVPT